LGFEPTQLGIRIQKKGGGDNGLLYSGQDMIGGVGKPRRFFEGRNSVRETEKLRHWEERKVANLGVEGRKKRVSGVA